MPITAGRKYTVGEIQEITGGNANLISFLIQEQGIPFEILGKAKLLDDDGLGRIRKALAEYRAKVRRNHEQAARKVRTGRRSKVAEA